MRLSIRLKIFIAVALSLVLIFGLTMYFLVTDTTHRLRSNLNQQSKSFASLATTPIGNTFLLYKDSGTIRIQQEVNQFSSLDPDISAISVVDTDGKLLFTNHEGSNQPVSAGQAADFQAGYTYRSGYIERIIQPLIEESGVHRYAIVYDISTKSVAQNVDEVIRLLMVIGVTFLVIGILATSWVLNTLFTKPLRALSRSAILISTGKYDEPIQTTQKDEIGDLAQSVKRMAESLKADIDKLKEVDNIKSEFMMITSHNLRTPLSMMRGYLEVAHEATSTDELKKLLGPIDESVNRMHLLAEDMLTIANLETGTVLPRTSLPLKQFLDSIGKELEPLARKGGLEWEFANQVPDDSKIMINQTSMRGALVAIIDNAMKFNKRGGKVSVKASVQDGVFIYEVVDSGIGIAPEEQQRLFTKFHRGTDTLTYNYEGAGIGLYLAKLIINQHGGDIAIRSQVDLGTACTVTLPLNPDGQKTNVQT